ncbi:TBC1 domain family member 10A isoform X1 [Gadus macrocephalus]|uniref:TBC1 domain family member 10A isoform X1 n=1 Tax=Gadus macrocephalus TaxID=80720 RepID=UPI0028CB8A96|nr:TBC1 domain family member 10A isoform X1 [Gadus macrocephalus]
MRRRSSTNGSRRSSITKQRSDNRSFDEFGFALTKRKDQKLYHRCHDYRYPQMSPARVKELCELLSYWKCGSFICRSQIERYIRMGIPPSLRGRVWKCLLGIDSQRETSDFNYQSCLSEVRGPLVDLGVSEYGILSAIATLSDTQNDLGSTDQPLSSGLDPGYSRDDVTLFRQIALDLQRSFPSHRSLMGDSPEAIEGQAKLFRVLIAYAKYNPKIGYSQGMSYLAAVLLMQLGEEEAFWALVVLLDKPKYLAQLFDLNLTEVQHQVKVIHYFLKHRKPQLSQHLESMGVSSVHFIMPWLLTLFTSLPCWDSVLAVWDLIMLNGVCVVFQTSLAIMELLEPLLLVLNDETTVLPLLLRVPVNIAQYSVLVPALWSTEVQDWEIKCMSSLVLDDTLHGPTAERPRPEAHLINPIHDEEHKEKENIATPSQQEQKAGKGAVGGAKGVLTRLMRLAQRNLLDPATRWRAERKTPARPTSPVPGPFHHKGRVSASLTKARAKSRRRCMHRGGSHCTPVGGASDDVAVAPTPGMDAAVANKEVRPERAFKRTSTGPVGKVARRRSNSGVVQPIRAKSFQSPGSVKPTARDTRRPAPSSSALPPSLRSVTFPACTPPSRRPASSAQPGVGRPATPATPRTALIRELSSRHQSMVPFRNAQESQLI